MQSGIEELITDDTKENNLHKSKMEHKNTIIQDLLQNTHMPKDYSRTAPYGYDNPRYNPLPPKVLAEQNANFKSIMLEHCYSRPHNWRPETNFLRPTKTLFITQSTTVKKKSNSPVTADILDVETVTAESPTIYDMSKASKLMEECNRHASFARDDQSNDDWEEKISRSNWTPGQNHLFNIMVNILNSDRMSRLAYAGVHNEPILRRTVVDKSVKRFRQLMAKYSWDTKLAQWLHQLLIDNLSTPYLATYFDMLQTLKHKLPTFIDKLLYGPNSHNRVGAVSNESLFQLIKRPWDPVATSLNQDKPKKLPGNPIIVVIPSAPCTPTSSNSKRLHKWINLFTNLATVCTVYNNIGSTGSKLTMTNCVDQMFSATRSKIQELKAEFPNRPIVLAGFNAGAALALQVAHVETVLCILCIGFSMHTAEGNRGEPDDNLLELQFPALFVIGQSSNTSLQEHMEDLRERMRVETGLLVVGAADDYLRVNKKKKRAEGITQPVVDRCIVDEIGEFVSGLLLSPYPPQIRQSPAHIPPDIMKRPKVDRKRNNSNGSSLDSEPPSPTLRISRPGQSLSPIFGRPPGSKSKSKIEAKWHAMQQGIPPPLPNIISPSSTPPPISLPNTPDSSITDTNEPLDLIKTNVPTPEKSAKLPTPLTPKLPMPLTPKSPQSTAKLQALGIPPGRNLFHGSTLSSLLQGGGVRTLPPNPQGKQIKVLENLTIASSGSGKLLTLPGRTIDMSKMTVLNSSNQSKMNLGNNYGNVMYLPDGKIKTSASMKGIVNAPPVTFVTKGKTIINSPNSTHHLPTTTTNAKTSLNKYITSKKQLLANRNKINKKIPPYISAITGPAPNLPPPTNLTSQDIMDLPIIFADDNQMLANNTMQPSDTPSAQILQSTQYKTNLNGKYVFINKQASYPQNMLKRQYTSHTKTNPIKYAKIILSKAPPIDDFKKNMTPHRQIANLQPDVSIKKLDTSVSMDIDLETELIATAITKPNFVPSESKNVALIYKKAPMSIQMPMLLNEEVKKKHNRLEEDSDDPEYVPNKLDLL